MLPFRLTAQSLFSQLTILVKQHGEPEFGRLWRKPADVDLPDDPLREPALDGTQILLETAHDDIGELLRPHRNTSAESLRVKDLQHGGEAIGVPVMGGSREEKTVLEPPGQVADGPGDLRVDRVPCPARGGGVVCLVENQ